MNLIRFNGFLFFIAVSINYSLAGKDDVNHVETMPKQTNYNCTLNALLRDIFKYNSSTSNSSHTNESIKDSEKGNLFLGSVGKLYVSNTGTPKENGSIEQTIVDGIISSINTIKNNFTFNINNETDATRLNETFIIENSTHNYLLSIPEKESGRNNFLAQLNFEKTPTETDIINATTTSSKPSKYIEVLTIEPNNTTLNVNKSSENIIELLKHIMPKLQGSLSNITVVERKDVSNDTMTKSGNISTIIVAYCNENPSKTNNSALKETGSISETFKHENVTNNDDYLLMEASHVENNGPVPEEMNLTQLEQRNVLEAADYGIQMMHELYSIKEPKLYSMGLWLDDTNPARYVAAFNAPSEDSAKYFRYGYASLQAAQKLQQLHSGGVGGDEDSLRARTEEAVAFPGAGALRNSALLEQCPLKGAPKCPPASKRYRTHDGTCNNLSRPRWGSSMTPVQRFLAPHYADGLQAPRRSASGSKLPSPREISALVHEDHNVEAASITHLLMQWGQFVDHDLTSSSQSRGFNGSVPRCCKGGGKDFVPKEFMHPECMPIAVPASDRFYGPLGVRCLEFVRSSPAPQDDCSLGWREQLNQVSAYLDGSPLYGSSARTSDRLRLFRNGMLQYGRVQQSRPILPTERTRKDELCRAGAVSTDCFKSGDNRVNEHPGLVAAHIVWLRQHNRMATELAHLNPHWSDEKIYQETRKIVGAMLQHITYNEFLPIVLGSEVMRLFDLEPQKKGFYRNYNPKVNPSPASSFGSAAFRFGHSLVQGSMMRYDRHHRPMNNNVSLHEELTNPTNIWSVGAVDRLLLGMVNQPIQKRDEFITEELTNHLFQTPQFDFGMDLAAINIQRGRDHGMAAYTAWREPCGLTEIRDFENLFRVMPSRAVRKLEDLYRNVDDIDLFTGGMAERPVVGGLVGPTFACIIAQQFSNLRKGDRFWYENGVFDSSFTPAQLQQIRRITLAQVLCKTLDSIDNIQPFVFLAADLHDNRRISCANGILNNFDLSPWIEIDPTLGNDVEFKKSDKITEKPVIKQNTTKKQTDPDSKPTNDIDQFASSSNRLIQTKPLPLLTITNSTKAQNSLTKKKTRPRPYDNKKTDHLDRLNTKETSTTSNIAVQKIDDKLDFRNKSRRYENYNDEDDNTPYNAHTQKYDFNHHNNNYDDSKYEDDESNIYQQAVVINNHHNQRPNKFNRPVIAVTENIDKFTYLINYVPKTTPRPWRQTTRRPNYDRDVVKVTYQTYGDTYRRPQQQPPKNHQTLTTYFNNRLVQKPIDQYDEYRRLRPESLTTRYADNVQSSARASDFKPFTKVTAAVSQKATTKDEVTFPTTTEQFYRLVTFSHLGTYNQMTDYDNKVFIHKKQTEQINTDQTFKKSDSNMYSKDFTLTNDKAYKQDIITTDQFTTSIPPRLSTFFLSDKELRQNLLSRPTFRPNIKQGNRTNSTTDKLDTTKTPGRYYYAANVLHRYPDVNSSISKTELKRDKIEAIKEKYNNPGRPDIQERSSVDSMKFFEDFDKDSTEDLFEKGGKVRVVKPNEAHKTHSVAFQVIPSENGPATWAVYEEKSEPVGVPPRTMPAVHSDPHALQELPRPMNLSAGNISRRKPKA